MNKTPPNRPFPGEQQGILTVYIKRVTEEYHSQLHFDLFKKNEEEL